MTTPINIVGTVILTALIAMVAANALFAIWLVLGRPSTCGRCNCFHLIRWRTMKSSLFNGRWCPHCGSGKVVI